MAYCALLLFFFVEYVRPGNHFPPLDLLRINSLVPLVAILGTLVLRTPISTGQFFAEATTKAMAFFLTLLVLSTLTAPVTTYAYTVAKNVFAYMLMYMVLVRQVASTQRIKGVFAALTIVHAVVIGLSPEMFTNSSGRASVTSGAFLGDGNDFSLSVNVCLPLSLFLLLESRSKVTKLLWVIAVLLLVFAVIATKSRGGTVALVTVGLYFWLKSRRKALSAVMIVVAAATVFLLAPPEYFSRMATMTDTEESSASSRIDAWSTSVDMALRNPILGSGAGHFGSAYGQAVGGRWMTAHSIYFLVLGELGIPGISVLLFLIFYNLAANRRLQRQVKRLDSERSTTYGNLLACTSASLVGFAVAGAFLSAAYYPHLYVVSGVLVAARGIVRSELAECGEPVGVSIPAHPRLAVANHSVLTHRPGLVGHSTARNRSRSTVPAASR